MSTISDLDNIIQIYFVSKKSAFICLIAIKKTFQEKIMRLSLEKISINFIDSNSKVCDLETYKLFIF